MMYEYKCKNGTTLTVKTPINDVGMYMVIVAHRETPVVPITYYWTVEQILMYVYRWDNAASESLDPRLLEAGFFHHPNLESQGKYGKD